MAALFLLALVLIAWQAVRTKPLGPAPLALAWTGGEQVFPVAAPFWGEAVVLPATDAERSAALLQKAVPWPGVATGNVCEIFVRISSTTWVRRKVDPARLDLSPGEDGRLRYGARDFLDDDDADGDPLDPGELTSSGAGADVDLYCPPPTEASTPP